MKRKVEKFDLETEEHLARYLANREERTGQKWVVVEKYRTDGTRADDRQWSRGWDRALIRAEEGSTLRIYHYGSCWLMGQKVLVHKYGSCRLCGKPCTFNHDVPAEEIVCDVCAGVPEDEVDW